MPALSVNWDAVKNHLTHEIPQPLFNTWIRPTSGEVTAEDTFCVYVSNRIAQDYIKRNLQSRILLVLKEFGFDGNLQIVVRGRSDGGYGSATETSHTGGATALSPNNKRLLQKPAPTPATGLAGESASESFADIGLSAKKTNNKPPSRDSGDRERSGDAHAAESMDVARAPREGQYTQNRTAAYGQNQLALPSGLDGAAGQRKDVKRKSKKTNLKSQYTFDNFIGGKSNLLATSIGKQIVSDEGPSFNPLYICGGVGLGKTHLMHAIGNAMHEKNKEMRVFYVSASDFVTDVVTNYQNKTYDLIKEKYSDLDLLLIDDVQNIAGKERTQDEFFHIFESMLARKSQVVLTSDTYVKKLKVSDRLASRFMAGVEVYIEPPEIEMRVSILLQKGREVGIALKNEVAFFIAQNIKNNVRELNGAVKTLMAQKKAYNIGNDDISIDFVKQALKNILQVQNTQITAEIIQRKVAEFYNIKISDMHSKVRTAKIAKPRQIAMYLIRELTQMSYPDIGGHFGGKDHTTIIHAVKKIGSERNLDEGLNKELHLLEQMIKE